MKISKEQIAEWTENPVTEALFGLASEELERVNSTPIVECYYPGDPNKTQDNVVDLNTRGITWAIFCELLDGDWSYLEEDSEE